MVPDFQQRAGELNESGVGFVMADLGVALTLMDVADTSGLIETKQRNHRNARKAYDSVVRLLEKLLPNPEQQAEIDLKLETLKNRLIAAGQRF
jgi:hypothetical protein